MKISDKKTVTILVLLALSAVMGIGWLKAALGPQPEEIPHDNTYNWAEYFHGYEAYLDQRISYAVMIGTSMAPTIKDNDVVLWVEVDNMAELKVGDIIIYQHPTRPYLDNIAHRIIEVGTGDRENQFLTKGDNSSEEYWVPEGNIHGLVIGVIYKNGS